MTRAIWNRILFLLLALGLLGGVMIPSWYATADDEPPLGSSSSEPTSEPSTLPSTPPPLNVTWSATANGVQGTQTTTEIGLTFSESIEGMIAENISFDGNGIAIAGSVSGSGNSWNIPITEISQEGSVTVSVTGSFPNYTVTPSSQSVNVYKEKPPEPTPKETSFDSATADGSSGSVTSTRITLVFSQPIEGLSASNISISNGTGAAALGSGGLSGSGTNWSAPLSVEKEGTVTVTVSAPQGYMIVGESSKSVTVCKAVESTRVNLVSAKPNGELGKTTTTKIDLTFSQAVTGLTEGNLAIINGSGAATKGKLTGSGTLWFLELTSVETEGTVQVSVTDIPGFIFEGTPKDVNVYKGIINTELKSAVADGSSRVTTSKKIVLTFSQPVTGLVKEDITISNGTGEVVKGSLFGSGTSWEIYLTDVIKEGTVSVAVASPPGYKISGTPKSVNTYRAGTEVKLLSAIANGSPGKTTSTEIVLKFDRSISGLTASHITISNGTGSATKGSLSAVSGTGGTTWKVTLTSVSKEGSVSVAVASPTGYNVIDTPKTIDVYRGGTSVTLSSATANGSPGKTTSTEIVLKFSQSITGLTASHITISSGSGSAIRGTLTGSGTTWRISLNSVSKEGTVSVAVASPTGYSITGTPKTVNVYRAGTSVTLSSATANGSPGKTTSTEIVLKFSQSITGLTASHITISNGTGSATKGILTGSGTTWRISLNSVSKEGTVSVAVASPTGYSITGTPKTVNVFRAGTSVTLSSATANGSPGKTTSTEIVLKFSQSITGLTASHITISSGSGSATKGTLTGSGTTWRISLNSVSKEGTVSVAVASPTGYSITGTPKTVNVYRASTTYRVTVSSIGAGYRGSGDYSPGAAVQIYAGVAPAGMRFREWSSADGVVFASRTQASTTFVMPEKVVSVRAVFEELPDTPVEPPEPPVIVEPEPQQQPLIPAEVAGILVNGMDLGQQQIDLSLTSHTLDISFNALFAGKAEVVIPFALLMEWQTTNEDFVLECTTPYGSYQVPVNLGEAVSDLDELFAAQGLTPEEVSFYLAVTDRSADQEISTALASAFPGSRILGSIVDFSLEIVDSVSGTLLGQVEAFTQQVPRGIAIPQASALSGDYSVFRYDESSGGFAFVPHVVGFIDGQAFASILSRSNSTYVVVENYVEFTDVTEDKWYVSTVERAAAKGLVRGVGNQRYDPERPVTRAEFVAMMVTALDLSQAEDYGSGYIDVAPEAWYYHSVMRAQASGLLDKFSEEVFYPEDPITRQEMAVIMAGALRLHGTWLVENSAYLQEIFADAGEMNPDYLEELTLVCQTKLLVGLTEDHFVPKGVTTRAQAATVQIRVLTLLGLLD